MISSSNTAPSSTNDNPDEGGVWQPGYYRTGHNDLFQGRDGLEDAILMGADGLLTDSFPEGTGDAADGMYLTGPYVAGDAYSDFFLAKWDAKFEERPQRFPCSRL
ncbi:MAG: hypothetical protein R2932_32605 [Caldilineaceae bacterium]